MRIKLGKILNGFKQCIKCQCLPSGSCCCLCNDIKQRKSSNQANGNKLSVWGELKLIYMALFYNQHNDSLTVLETMLTPFVEFVSNLIRFLGWFLVAFVWVLVLNMLFVFFCVILPQIYRSENLLTFAAHLLLGIWLAINTIFHYWKGQRTSPGHPPNTDVENIVTMCKKCIAPKPPRTHHCSICKKCVLKMDHHCPWFNNCIGFYNHRYFFLFCLFLVIDSVYLSTFGFHYYQSFVYTANDVNIITIFMERVEYSNAAIPYMTYFKVTTCEFLILFTASIAVLFLVIINGYIISYGATNIEVRTMRIPCVPSTYNNPKNPYDLGFVNNWKVFLGVDDFKSVFFKLILPSSHKPLGDGMNWNDYFNYIKYNQDDSFIV